MKKAIQKMTSLAMAAVMGFSAAGMTAAEPVTRLFGGNTIVAEAAVSRWYPVLNDVTVHTANNYAALCSQSGSSAVVAALNRTFRSGQLQTTHANRRIVYTTSSNPAYNNIILMYDQSQHSDLNCVFFSTNMLELNRGKDWLVSAMQVFNTMKEISGTELPQIVISMDENCDNSNACFFYNESGNIAGGRISVNAPASKGLEHCIEAFNNNYFFNWTLLHEAGHLYEVTGQSPFNCNDEAYCNLLALCSVAALKKAGVSVPDVLRDKENGPYQKGGNSYEAVSALRYAEDSIKEYYTRLSTLANANQLAGISWEMLELGILFQQALNVNPWGSGYVLDNAVTSKSSSMWGRLYAMCICNPDNVTSDMMYSAKLRYSGYLGLDMTDHTKCIYNNQRREEQTAPEVANMIVRMPIQWYGGQRYYKCTTGFVRGLNALDFLQRQKNKTLDDIIYDPMPGNSNISYWQFAKKVL